MIRPDTLTKLDLSNVKTRPPPSINASELASSIVSDALASRKITPHLADDDLGAEAFCFCAAVEFMIPWKIRGKITDDRANGATNFDLAYRLRIPEFIVEEFFAGGHANLSDCVNRELDSSRLPQSQS